MDLADLIKYLIWIAGPLSFLNAVRPYPSKETK